MEKFNEKYQKTQNDSLFWKYQKNFKKNVSVLRSAA